MERNLEAIYENRFQGTELERSRLWQALTAHYFQHWIAPTDAVLDLGAGYCEFINNIRAAKKYALDLNPVMPLKAAPGVEALQQSATEIKLAANSVDVVFSSNFFEHLPSKNALQACLAEAYRVLRPGGRLLALGPNIRFCYDVYWDFFDHFIPLSDRSLVEALELIGFQTEKVIPRFLPYTMKNRRVPSTLLVRLYLALPIFWPLMGKQFFVVARKPVTQS